MTMRKRGILALALIGFGLPSWCADFWDGNAAILRGDTRFESGIYAASNSFNMETEIQIENLENQKIVTAIVTQRISGQSDILVFLSPKAGESLGMTQGRMNRVRVKVPVKTISTSSVLASDRVENPDPDINPSAGMTQPALSTAPQSSQASSEAPAASSIVTLPSHAAAANDASALPAPSSNATPEVGAELPQARQAVNSTTGGSTPAPSVPAESIAETTLQKSTEGSKAPEIAATATPEAPASTESPKPAAETTTAASAAAPEAAAPEAAAAAAPEAAPVSRPAALDEVLSRVPQKRLFLPPRQDELFAQRKPVSTPAQPETAVAQKPVTEPPKETVKEPAKEPDKAVPQATVQTAETPMVTGLPSSSASSGASIASKISATPTVPMESIEVGDGEEIPRSAAVFQTPGHEPIATEEKASVKDEGTSEISDSAPENPVWAPSIAEFQPTTPNLPAEEVKPAVVEKPAETGPEEAGIGSDKNPASESGLPTSISETPKIAPEATVETASDLSPMGIDKTAIVTAKPKDQPKEPMIEVAPETAVKPATETAVKPATETKPETGTVVVLEQTKEKPPETKQKPVETAIPETVQKPVVASNPTTSLPVKAGTLKAGEFYLQLAAYATESIAQETIKSLSATYPVGVLPPAEKGKPLYRVVVGPLNKSESGTLLNWFKYRGFPDAFLKAGE